MFLKEAFKKTLRIIKANKKLFLLLFILQLVFIITFALIQFKYQVALAQNFKDILEPVQNANYNTTLIQMGTPFMQDTSQILTSWSELKSNLFYLITFSFLAFISFNGLIWAFTHYLIKKQNILKTWGKFIALASIFYLPYFLILYLIFESPILQINPLLTSQFIVALAFIFIYFAMISFSFASLKFKQIFKKTFWQVGIKKFHKVVLIYAITIIILAFFNYLIFYSVNFWPVYLLAILIILLILAMNTLRIFIINSFLELA